MFNKRNILKKREQHYRTYAKKETFDTHP